MADIVPLNLNYKIYNPKYMEQGTPLQDLNSVYKFWSEFWRDIFGQTGHADELNPEHFIRADMIGVVHVGKHVAGLMFHTFFNINALSTKENSYFSYLSDDSWEHLRSLGLQKLLVMEYFTVNKDFRKSQFPFPVSEMLVLLSMRVLHSIDAQGAIGTPRSDNGAVQVGYVTGGETVQPNIKKYDYTCELLLWPRDKDYTHRDEKVENALNLMWANRMDYTGLTTTTKVPAKRVG